MDKKNANKDDIKINYVQSGNLLVINNNLLEVQIPKVTLFNFIGQSIASSKIENQEQRNIQIPIKSMVSGIYIAKLKTSEGELSKKLVVR